MPQGQHAVCKSTHQRERRKHVRRVGEIAAHHPHREVGANIRPTRRTAAQEIRTRGQRLFQRVELAAQLRVHVRHVFAEARKVHEVEEGLAVREQRLRQQAQIRAHGQSSARVEETAVRPTGQRQRQAAGRAREQRGAGETTLQFQSDQSGIAVDVGAHLQHRRAAVTAGQCGQVRLGWHHGNVNGLPGEALQPEHEPNFLGERRWIEMVQDQVRHGSP